MDPPADIVIRLARADPGVASVRYRGLAPALALKARGMRVAFCSGRDPGAPTPVAIAVKPLSDADCTWARQRRDAGGRVVLDLCDNIFVDGYGAAGGAIGARFARAAAGCSVSVPTRALKQVVLSHCGLPDGAVHVVPDVVETPQMLACQMRLLGLPAHRLRGVRQAIGRLGRGTGRILRRRPVLLWFGNHGASWGAFGLSDLMLVREALETASRRHRAVLWVVSNDRARFEAMRAALPIESHYFDWSPERLDGLLPSADVCLVPNSLDAFARTKSANRAIKALAAGVPVVATPTPACDELQDCLWLGDSADGVQAYLQDPELRRRHLAAARRRIARDYSLDALGDALLRALGPGMSRT